MTRSRLQSSERLERAAGVPGVRCPRFPPVSFVRAVGVTGGMLLEGCTPWK